MFGLQMMAKTFIACEGFIQAVLNWHPTDHESLKEVIERGESKGNEYALEITNNSVSRRLWGDNSVSRRLRGGWIALA